MGRAVMGDFYRTGLMDSVPLPVELHNPTLAFRVLANGRALEPAPGQPRERVFSFAGDIPRGNFGRLVVSVVFEDAVESADTRLAPALEAQAREEGRMKEFETEAKSLARPVKREHLVPLIGKEWVEIFRGPRDMGSTVKIVDVGEEWMLFTLKGGSGITTPLRMADIYGVRWREEVTRAIGVGR